MTIEEIDKELAEIELKTKPLIDRQFALSRKRAEACLKAIHRSQQDH
jgi:hypothetical protein